MNIPQHAKKVFTGQIFDVYQWEQQLYDGTFATFEMLGRPDTVEVIATSGDKIYYSHQSQPNKENFYTVFGGRVDALEQPLEAAKRELLEESGMESDDWELFKVYEPYHKINWKIHTYIARNCLSTKPQKLDAGEKVEIIEGTFDQFIDTVTSVNYTGREFQTDVLRMKLNPPDLASFRHRIFDAWAQ